MKRFSTFKSINPNIEIRINHNPDVRSAGILNNLILIQAD